MTLGMVSSTRRPHSQDLAPNKLGKILPVDEAEALDEVVNYD